MTTAHRNFFEYNYDGLDIIERRVSVPEISISRRFPDAHKDLHKLEVMREVFNKVSSDNYTIGYKNAPVFREYDRVGSLETTCKVVEKYKKIAEQQKVEHFLELVGICKKGNLTKYLSHDLANLVFSFLKLTDIIHEVSSTPNVDNGDNEVSALGAVSDYNHDNCEQV